MEIAPGIVRQSLREKGLEIEACDALTFMGAKGGGVVGLVAGGRDFVRRCKEMGAGFGPYLNAYLNAQHPKIYLTGEGSIPRLCN